MYIIITIIIKLKITHPEIINIKEFFSKKDLDSDFSFLLISEVSESLIIGLSESIISGISGISEVLVSGLSESDFSSSL